MRVRSKSDLHAKAPRRKALIFITLRALKIGLTQNAEQDLGVAESRRRCSRTRQTDGYLEDIKVLVARYLFARARAKADKIWDEKQYTDELILELLAKDGNRLSKKQPVGV